MNDRIRDEYELDFTAKGAAQVEGQLNRLQDTLDNLARSGDLSEAGLRKLSQTTQRIGSSVSSSTASVTRYSDAFTKLRREASQAETAIQRAAQNYVGRGGTNPLGYSVNNLNLADAQRYNAIQQASNLTLQQAAQERLRLEERLNTARREGADIDRQLANSGRDRTTVAKENLALTQQELQAARQQSTSLGASGGRRGGGDATITDQVAAEERLTTAKRGVLTAQRELNSVTAEGTQSTSALRYANYDLAASYGAISASLIGVGAITATTFADIESGFSAVERTSGLYGEAVEPLRNELLELSRVLPVTTQELQSFATRGAQLGIATNEITSFTDTIARFVATSPDVDINSVAEAFGRISNLTGTNDFEALASAVAQVGVNAAATDQQIIKTTQEIARATAATTLSADEVIGLAGAFASLGVAPEAARGIFNQFFTQLDKGAAGLNDSLSVAAQIIGTTEENARQLYATDSGEFFQQFVDGLAGVENISEALDALGTQGARLGPAFKALAADSERNAAGQSVLARSLADANQGFAERTELERQYAPIADDLNSRITLLGNAFRELAYSIGLELAPALKGGVDALTSIIQAVATFVESPVGGYVTQLAFTIGALVAAYTGLRAVIALASASLIAFTQVSNALKGVGLAAALRGIATNFLVTKTAADGATRSVFSLNAAVRTLARLTIIGAVLQYVSEWMFNTGDAAIDLGNKFTTLANTSRSAFFDLARSVSETAPVIGFALATLGVTLGNNSVGQSLKDFGKEFNKNKKPALDFSDAISQIPAIASDIEDYSGGAADGVSDIGDAAADAAEQVYTLVDYGNDLSSVFQRAFDIRFGGEESYDGIQNTYQRLADEAEAGRKRIADLQNAIVDANQKIRDTRTEIKGLQADQQGLRSDIGILEYYKSIALAYGDTQRAAALDAELAKKRADLDKNTNSLNDKTKELSATQQDIRDKTAEVAAEQDKLNRSTIGNTQSARDNRAALRDLASQYQTHIARLAAAGLSQAELQAESTRLRAEFIRQATQLGYNRTEVLRYATAFDDVRVAIQNVPRNITVSANVNPALQALNEFNARVRSSIASARQAVGNGINIPIGTSSDNSGVVQNLLNTRSAYQAQLRALYETLGGNSNVNTGRLERAIRSITTELSRYGYASGGYTGTGGTYQAAGIVHRGEYVIPKRDVNQATGLPYADALARLGGGVVARGSAPSGSGTSQGAATVTLSAGSIQALAQAVQPYLVVGDQVIAQAANRSYAQSNAVGAY